VESRPLFVIEDNIAGNGYRLLSLANQVELPTHFLTSNPSKFATRAKNPCSIADRVSIVDTLDAAKLLRACHDYDPLALAPVIDFNTIPSALAAREYDLVHPPIRSLVICRNKDLTREVTNCIGYSVHHSVCSSASSSIPSGPWPRVFKPLNESGGFGVTLCETEADVRRAKEFLLRNLLSGSGYSRSADFLLEEAIEGPEFSAEVSWNSVTSSWDTVAFVQKHVGGNPHFIELGHTCPHSFGEAQDAFVAGVIGEWLGAVGLKHTVAHVEFRLCNGRPALIEINPRPAGGRIPDLVRATTGVDLLAEYLDVVTGGLHCSALANTIEARFAAIAFVMPSRSGDVVDIEWSRAHQLNVCRTGIMPGTKHAAPWLSNDDRAGFVIAHGETADEAWCRAERAAADARLVYG
jgi:biotin carboxylase